MPFFIDVFNGFYQTAIVPTFIDIVPFLINIVPTNNLFLTVNDVTMSLLALYVEQCVHQVRYRQVGVQGPELGWNYPDGLFVGKVIFILVK